MTLKKEVVYGILFSFILVLFIGIGFLCSGGITSAPEQIVKNHLKAIDNEAATEAASYWIGGNYFDQNSIPTDAIYQIAAVDISNIKTSLASKEDFDAVVELSYDLELKTSTGTSKAHYEGLNYLIKLGNKWWISDTNVLQTSYDLKCREYDHGFGPSYPVDMKDVVKEYYAAYNDGKYDECAKYIADCCDCQIMMAMSRDSTREIEAVKVGNVITDGSNTTADITLKFAKNPQNSLIKFQFKRTGINWQIVWDNEITMVQ